MDSREREVNTEDQLERDLWESMTRAGNELHSDEEDGTDDNAGNLIVRSMAHHRSGLVNDLLKELDRRSSTRKSKVRMVRVGGEPCSRAQGEHWPFEITNNDVVS